MEDVKVLNIENKNYLVVEEVTFHNNRYVLLVNENDEDDERIQKIINKDDKEYITNLESQDEVIAIMKLISEKHLKNE